MLEEGGGRVQNTGAEAALGWLLQRGTEGYVKDSPRYGLDAGRGGNSGVE